MDQDIKEAVRKIKETCMQRDSCHGCEFYSHDDADCQFRTSMPEDWFFV